jgi:hypothetical protein
MVDLEESRKNIEENISKKEKEPHVILIRTYDKDYIPLDKKESDETKNDVKKIKYLLSYLIRTQNIQTEIPAIIPELLSPKRIKGERSTGIEEKFESLVKKWKEETVFASTILEMATNPAYQQIIGMGPVVIPLLLDRLAKELDHWFWALKAITGEDPVPENSRGKLDQMAKAWLAWGKEEGYVK